MFHLIHSRHAHASHFPRILGTSLEIQCVCFGSRRGTRKLARRVEASVLEEIARLEAVLSVHRPDSELSRWAITCGGRIEVSGELAEVLEAAEHWRRVTRGAFDAALDVSIDRAADAVGDSVPRDQPPAGLDRLRWRIDRGEQGGDGGRTWATKLVDGPVNPDGVAKGYVIDAACRAGHMRARGLAETRGDGSAEISADDSALPDVTVNVGGDLRHMGPGGITVAVVDPFADAENAPPVARVRIAGQGMATSGGYRRGSMVGGRWVSHILDPRSGLPVEQVVSASVVADSATAADALATAFSVLDPEESLAIAAGLNGVACLLILRDGTRVSGGHWNALVAQGT